MISRLFGSPLSPYSLKTRAYLRFKRIAHEWVVRTAANMEEFNRYARIPLIPMWLPSDAPAMQDSTLIIEHLEALHPQPAAVPPDEALAFMAWLLEEYADEWGNRLLAHFRWYHDGADTARRTVAMRWPEGAPDFLAAEADKLMRERVPKILSIAGANASNAAVLEASLDRLVRLLEAHLERHDWLLGGLPCVADFALAGQLDQCCRDPSAGVRIRAAGAVRLQRWAERALDPPAGSGAFTPWEQLAPTLVPLLRDEVGAVFLRWSVANAAGGADDLPLPGGRFNLSPQRYSSVSLQALHGRYRSLQPDARDRADRALAACAITHFHLLGHCDR